MTEESQAKSGQSPDKNSSEDVSAEWQDLGQNLRNVFQNTWESEERRKLQDDIEAGLADFASSINKAVEDFKESPTGQRLKTDVDDFHERVKSGEVEGKAREEVAAVLRSINFELKKVTKSGGKTSKVEGEDSEEN
jgi:hypothetical protein